MVKGNTQVAHGNSCTYRRSSARKLAHKFLAPKLGCQLQLRDASRTSESPFGNSTGQAIDVEL